MSPVPQGEDNRDKPPDHPDDQLNHQDPLDVVIDAGDSSDSEGENEFGGYMGYQMLAQDVNDNDGNESEGESDEHEDSDENAGGNAHAGPGPLDEDMVQHVTYTDFPNTQNLPEYMKVPEMPRPEKRDLLWNQPRHCNMVMDPGHADKIRSAMSGFQLPISHIPDWAKFLNENQWQEQVVNRLVAETSCDNQSHGSDSSRSSLQQEVSDIQTEAGTSVSQTGNSEDSSSGEPSKSDSEVETSKL